MKRLAGVVALAALAGLQLATSLSAEARSDRYRVSALFPDVAGRVFEPGEEAKIRWELKGPGVRYFESNPWGECELLFSADDGLSWTRVTPRLSVSRRDYDWVVPNVPTESARIGLQIGIEGDGEFHQFASEPFAIRASSDVGSVSLAATSGVALRGGSTFEIEWTSTVAGVERFEVLVSSDRGAHFFSVGETTQSRFSYVIPDEYEGSLLVQIVAHRHGSPPLRSALNERASFVVKAAGSDPR